MSGGLIDRRFIEQVLTREAPWCSSHGADGDYLGAGLLYYGLVYALRARVAVCLGSGGGFVPRLMRQAQRDLGIADQSRTLLIDANRPEAGWGAPAWLDPDSFFRTRYGDVELVVRSTREAASELLRPQGLSIDYLHIDADHSFAGCLDDFELYRPLLREGAIVTLHDTRFPGTGVRHVVERIRTLGDCEVVDLAELGSGLALVRIGGTAAAAATPAREFGGGEEPVAIVRRGDAPALEPSATGWAYLESEAFKTRNALAARFVEDCPAVIEIGGGRTPIDAFVRVGHDSIHVIDPFITEQCKPAPHNAEGRVWHVRARFQDITWTVQRPGAYGLVMLGLELQGLSDADYRTLATLIDSARVTVIEFPTSWEPSRQQYQWIRAHTATRERFRCAIDYSGNDMGDLSNSWPPRFEREIHVLEPRNGVPGAP